jgi:predicted nucleotidyltransferase component of viral defense system
MERDCIFGWLLTGIYDASWLRDARVLKGGNCFRKAFPHTRFSKGLDFCGTAAVQEDNLAAELNKICDFVQEPMVPRTTLTVAVAEPMLPLASRNLKATGVVPSGNKVWLVAGAEPISGVS